MEKLLKNYNKFGVFIILVFTSILRAVAIDTFLLPNKISNGGASGIAIILSNKFGWSQGLVALLINVPLLIMAYFFLNKKFVFYTIVATGLTSFFTELLSGSWWGGPGIPSFVGDHFAATIGGGACWGIALGLLLKINCSTGGSDIAGLLVQNKFPNMKVVWLIFAIDACVGIVNGFVAGFDAKNSSFGLAVGLYSIIAVFVASFVSDVVQRGIVSTVEFKIITDKHQEIANYIIRDLKRSITALKATGMYTRSDKYFLICVVRKRQVQEVKEKIHSIDPNAFFYMTGVSDIRGNGFDNTLTPSSKIN